MGFLSFRPLKCRDVEAALKGLGFEKQPSKGGSHRQFKRIDANGVMRKVTLDCHNDEVKPLDVKSIISQAGVSKSEFQKYLP